MSSKSKHRIHFGESPDVCESIINELNYHTISQSMYDAILQGPSEQKSIRGDLEAKNFYVFGHLFDSSEYKEIDQHCNDAAATGLWDFDMMLNLGKDALNQELDKFSEEVANFYSDNKEGIPWDHPEIKASHRTKYPFLLFRGETTGGDVGANLYAHYNANGEIDSLLIDNDYFFPKDDDAYDDNDDE